MSSKEESNKPRVFISPLKEGVLECAIYYYAIKCLENEGIISSLFSIGYGFQEQRINGSLQQKKYYLEFNTQDAAQKFMTRVNLLENRYRAVLE